MERLPGSTHCQLDGKSVKMQTVARIMSIILHELLNGKDHQRESIHFIYSFVRNADSIAPFPIERKIDFNFCSHMISASDIDAAATEFDRRFHISSDETEDQGNQVRSIRIYRLVECQMSPISPVWGGFIRIRFGLGMQMKMRMQLSIRMFSSFYHYIEYYWFNLSLFLFIFPVEWYHIAHLPIEHNYFFNLLGLHCVNFTKIKSKTKNQLKIKKRNHSSISSDAGSEFIQHDDDEDNSIHMDVDSDQHEVVDGHSVIAIL